MKLLVLSNVSGGVDKVVDAVQRNHNVVAKESTMANDALVHAAAGEIAKGLYDEIIVIAKDPRGAGMALNKHEGVEAAVCGSAEDVRMARGNMANVLLIRDLLSGELPELLDQIAVAGGVAQRIKTGIRMPRMEVRAPLGVGRDKAEMHENRGRDSRTTREREEVREEASEDEKKLTSVSGTRGGIIGKLKDSLGIL